MTELVIKLNDETYKEVIDRTEFDTLVLGIKLIEAVQNGTVLPKEHGDLIDSNILCEQYERTNGDLYQALDLTPIIIKENKEIEYDTSRTDCQSYEEAFCEARDCGECECKVEDKE